MPQSLREDAFFRREDGRWYYVDGNVHGQDPVSYTHLTLPTKAFV